MYEITQSQIARAIDVLRKGPMRADVFASKMWPDRQYAPGDAGRAGHAVLRRLGTFGYVEKVGDLWITRVFPQSIPVQTPVATPVGLAVGPGERLPVRLEEGVPVGPGAQLTDGQREEQVERQRLQRLVQLADEPVAAVTHDKALGNIRIHGAFVDACIAEACAFAVLRGRSLNVYAPIGEMIVALAPVEGARALYVRWRQSGVPPEPPYRGGTCWFLMDDGVAAAPGSWKPVGSGRDWRMLEEPFIDRIQRQRAAAGLGPAVFPGARGRHPA